MIRGVALAAALFVVPLAARADDHKPEQQRSSKVTQGKSGQPSHTTVDEDTRAGSSGNTGPRGPGIERGQADGMAGGRTDRGPEGNTGIADDHTSVKESNKRANAANQARKQKGTAPQRADVEGGGAGTHEVNYAEPLGEEGKRIPSKAGHRGRATSETVQPGGSGPEGIAGHTSGGSKGPADSPEGQSTGAPLNK